MPLANQKALFDLDPEITYFNCAAQSPSLLASHAAGQRGLERKLHPWSPERDNLGPEMSRARQLFAELIGAEGKDIALMTSTSYGAAIGLENLKIQPGREILVLEGQFPSNYYAWQKLAARDNGKLRCVARPADGDWTGAILAQLSAATGLLALANCHWTDGTLIDLAAIAQAARGLGDPHGLGAAIFIDATQSIGAQPFDVAAIDPDYVACSAYKWLLSPDAVGFLYVAPRRQNGRPIEDNHGTRIQQSSMEQSSGYGERYIEGAARFDQGAADNMVALPMAVAALEQILAWQVPAIAETLAGLTDKIAAEAEARNMIVPPKAQRVAHFIGLRHPEMPADLAGQLKQQGIITSLRGAALRISPHLFNDDADIARLFAALDRAMF